VFCSYSHRDEHYLEVLKTWLVSLERDGLIEEWHDSMISAGSEWEEDIAEHLETSDMVLLLITPYFMASQYIYEKEISRAVENHRQGKARVIPIIVRPSPPWKSTPFGRLKALPKDGKPITAWSNQDDAWLDVFKGVQRAIEELQYKPRSPEPPGVSSEQFYREAVEWAWADGDLHGREVERLRDLASHYELGMDVASAIEREVMDDTKEGILERQEHAAKEQDRREQLQRMYDQARRLYQNQEWQAVIDKFEQIDAKDPAYADTEGLLESAREALNVQEPAEEPPEATEAAKRKAEELSVNLSQVEGSGSRGRITVKDVVTAAHRLDLSITSTPTQALRRYPKVVYQPKRWWNWGGFDLGTLGGGSYEGDFEVHNDAFVFKYEDATGRIEQIRLYFTDVTSITADEWGVVIQTDMSKYEFRKETFKTDVQGLVSTLRDFVDRVKDIPEQGH
jgi:hypothetical protein